jgi:hypothetical protein
MDIKTTEAGLIVPAVHINGTSADALIRGYVAAGDAIFAALQELEAAAPHERDYYLYPEGSFQRACEEHATRVKWLVCVRRQFMDLAIAVQAQDRDRRAHLRAMTHKST